MRKHRANVHKVVSTDFTSAEITASNVQNFAQGVSIVVTAQDVKTVILEYIVRTHARHIVKTNTVS